MAQATAPPSTVQCKPWCTDHRHSYCQTTSTSPAYGDIIVGDTDHGPTVFLWQSITELPLDQAEAYFRTGLDLVTRARNGAAA
ncbi:hypothetical protein [Spongiactinospora sp. TRM90649]|uniref:hypothetical protein n=1 Tax=Spongiactinospora sp. TRM90649 TaxID=3031114 RepID=UPI0023F63E24|nr:hypothetical protein [Spongiactinospora sp. TRM90649]MDF5758770.1 hypothetical protein [Spongiactinospora sp. TRM90649]